MPGSAPHRSQLAAPEVVRRRPPGSTVVTMTDDRSSLSALAGQRVEYGSRGGAAAGTDPFALFTQWFREAQDEIGEANAMLLATAAADGPDARIVLLKGFAPAGFTFFTNYGSAKGRQIAADPRVALVFPWHGMHRQVRVQGIAERTSAAESDAYFAQRPRGAQIGARASRQSQPVASREAMQEAYDRVAAEFADTAVPRPAEWGGYRVAVHRIEFWQGQANRFHDRFAYTAVQGPAALDEAGDWTLTRLDP